MCDVAYHFCVHAHKKDGPEAKLSTTPAVKVWKELSISVSLQTLKRSNITIHSFHFLLCISGAFLIPYIIALIAVGFPILFLEMAFGQFASLGTIAIWRICPLFKGGYNKIYATPSPFISSVCNLKACVQIYVVFPQEHM